MESMASEYGLVSSYNSPLNWTPSRWPAVLISENCANTSRASPSSAAMNASSRRPSAASASAVSASNFSYAEETEPSPCRREGVGR